MPDWRARWWFVVLCGMLLPGMRMPSAVAADATEFVPVVIDGRFAHPTRIIAKVRTGKPSTEHALTIAANRLRAVRGFTRVPGLVVLDRDELAEPSPMAASPNQSRSEMAAALADRIAALRQSGLFEYVEPDWIVSGSLLPPDAAFADDTLWGLRNTGQAGGVPGVDIDVVRAWDLTTGSNDVVVAVIDSGIRYTHRDLAAQMWRNTGEVAGNGRDDDNNGYVDDVFGINAITGSGNPMDDAGHGTHVAGTIGAAAHNDNPAVGVAWNVRLMALKFLDAQGTGMTSDAIECINYAVAHGAKIVNSSWGGPGYSQALYDAIASARAQGVLMVSAAGNGALSLDEQPEYPASFALENIVVVTAIDRFGERPGFANFGATQVDLGAPGVSIYSTMASADDAYTFSDGTSMAAPHVSGVAALVRARYPGISLIELRDRLLNTVTPTPALQGRTVTGGRVSAYQALVAAPDGVMELAVLPAEGSVLYHGKPFGLFVRVTDLVRVTGATVTATASGVTGVILRDDGVGLDAQANDGVYSGELVPPAAGASLTITVRAQVSGKTTIESDFTYELRPGAANDDFASRTAVTGVQAELTGSNAGATRETDEPSHAGREGGRSVWWSWTAPVATTVTLSTAGSNFDTLLAVYTGNAVDALTPVASNDNFNDPNASFPGSSRVSFPAAAGVTYHIAVDGVDGAFGDIALLLRTTIAPPNDNFANAAVIVGTTATVTGTTIAATREAGEPYPPESFADNSVWWRWTSPADGTARVRATGRAAMDVDVYVGSAVDALVRVPGRVNETENSYMRPWEVTFAARAGTTYAFAVTGALDDFELYLEMLGAPENDLFENSIQISGTQITIAGHNRNATREIGETVNVERDFGATVWWTWQAPQSGTLILEAGESSIDPRVSVHRGSNLATLERLAPGATAAYGRIPRGLSVRVEAGATYHIAIDSGLSVHHTGEIIVALTLVPTPANDHFAERIVVAGTQASAAFSTIGATAESGEPSIATPGLGMTLWWAWTAPSTSAVTVDLNGGQVVINAFTGDALAALTPVTNTSLTPWTQLVFRAEAGRTYFLAVDSMDYPAGEGTWMLSLAPVPVNDHFAQRSVLAGSSASLRVSTAGASLEPGEPLPHLTVNSTLWWTWTAPRNGTAQLHAGGFLGVYTGGTLATLTPVVDPLLTLGDASFRAVQGATYQIQVGAATSGELDLSLEMVDSPVNDLFADRIRLSGTDITVTGNLVGATLEPGEPDQGLRSSHRSIWWTWTAPTAGTVHLSTPMDEYSITFGVYQGTSVGTLTRIPSTFSGPETKGYTFVATAGATYQICLGPYTWPQPIEWRLRLFNRPANDNFAARATLSGTSIAINTSSLGATVEDGEPSPNGYGWYGASVWWQWTAPVSGTVIVRAVTDEFQSLPGVYTGTVLQSLSPVPPDVVVYSPGSVRFPVSAGTTYQVSVGGVDGTWGDFTLHLNVYTPPPNDQLGLAGTINGTAVTVTGANVSATTEPDEPPLYPFESGGMTVWWKWAAPSDGLYEFVVASDEFDPMVNVFRGNSVSELIPVDGNQGASDRVDSVVFRAIQGVTYRIGVDGRFGLGGGFTLRVRRIDVPTNDRFASRAILIGDSAVATGEHFAATAEAGEPAHRTAAANHSLWWTWTPSASGTAWVTVTPKYGGYPAHVAVYAGGALNTITPVGGQDGPWEQVQFRAIAGTAYHIAVDTVSEWGGEFKLEVDLFDAPANDMRSHASPLVGDSASATATNTGATVEFDEPEHGLGVPHATVWWRWTPASDGRGVVQVWGDEIAPGLAVYRQSAAGVLQFITRARGYAVDGNVASVVFPVSAAAVYLIAVDGMEEATGEMEIRARVVQPPVNDNFADRIHVGGDDPATTTGTNLGSTGESGETASADLENIHSVWWSWTAPVSGPAVASAAGSDFLASVTVYTGSSLGSLNTVATSVWNAPEDMNRARFTATAGTTYHVAVSGRAGAMGNIELTMRTGQPPTQADALLSSDQIVAGGKVTLTALVVGEGPFVYQWLLEGYEIPGANGASLVLPSAQSYHAGNYTVRVTNDFGTIVGGGAMLQITEPPPSAARLLNLSTRAECLTGDNVLIPGFYIAGSGTKKLLIRAVGPTLRREPFKLTGVLSNPRMRLMRWDGAKYVEYATNDDWGAAPNLAELMATSQEVYAFPLQTDSLDAAMLINLPAGQYSVITDGPGTGIAVVELYDADDDGSSAQLINISTRGYVGAGDSIMIPGFVVSPEGPKTLLIRAIGPGLKRFGVSDVLSDPTLAVYQQNYSNTQPILTNDDWNIGGDAQRAREVAAQVHAFALSEGSNDAALVVTLNPGIYTVHARGANGTSGVGLVEVYVVP